MQTAVEVYLRSFSVRDVDSLMYARQHTLCAPDLSRNATASLQGRGLDSESAALLPFLDGLEEQSKVYDLGRLSRRVKALAAGVRRAPTAVVDGPKSVGLVAARTAL
jgi:hypothetical protein